MCVVKENSYFFFEKKKTTFTNDPPIALFIERAASNYPLVNCNAIDLREKKK